MLILPDKLIRYTGVGLHDKNDNHVGYMFYCIPSNLKKLARRYEYKCASVGWSNVYAADPGPVNTIIDTIDNTPQEYELLSRKRDYRYTSWFVRHGSLITELDDDNFCEAVLLGLQDRKFNCTFVWIYDGGKMKLVVKDSDIYNTAKQENITRKSKPIKANKLEFGTIYEDLNGNQMLYLGVQKMRTTNYSYSNSSYNPTPFKHEIEKVVYIHAGYRRDNKTYSCLKDVYFGYDTEKFTPRTVITKLNITMQDVKDELKKRSIDNPEFV